MCLDDMAYTLYPAGAHEDQLELDALVEELSAMLPKGVLYSLHEEATRGM